MHISEKWPISKTLITSKDKPGFKELKLAKFLVVDVRII
ncbi:hypothetical protein BN134_1141 [Cronobacter dublinensis 1210]|uniref:Uncharacterized protein n=1 Tax=Cronobacter dublinensis 1210 TaxID=1208656 RepID=A0ABM9Q4S1_9ENTR|nr:hypothetical protein BN134_1141 [Cronobacter dublinensis 1210]